jgi:hypothetical protein
MHVIYVACCKPRTRQRKLCDIPEPGNYFVPHLNIVVGWSGLRTAAYFGNGVSWTCVPGTQGAVVSDLKCLATAHSSLR